MYIKIVILASAISIAHTRPQLQMYQPEYFQNQETFQRPLVPINLQEAATGERAFISNLRNVQPLPQNGNPPFQRIEGKIKQDVNRRQDFPTGRGHIPPNQNFDNLRRTPPPFLKTEHQNHIQPVQNDQFVRTNPVLTHERLQQVSIQGGELRTNKDTQQNNIRPVQNNSEYPRFEQTASRQNNQQSDLKTNVDNTQHRVKINRHKGQHSSNVPVHNPDTEINVVNKQTSSNKHMPVSDKTLTLDDKVIKPIDSSLLPGESTEGIDHNRKTVIFNENGYNGRSSNSSSKPVLASANPAVLSVNKGEDVEGRMGDDDMKSDGDRWVWGTADAMTETTPTTPDVDDRASFDGDACPMGKVKVGTICVVKH